MIADIEPAAVESFRRYEDRVLPLLARHGGRLQRRLRTADGTTEVHVLDFDGQEGYDAYMRDPERAQARAELADAAVVQRVLAVGDVPV